MAKDFVDAQTIASELSDLDFGPPVKPEIFGKLQAAIAFLGETGSGFRELGSRSARISMRLSLNIDVPRLKTRLSKRLGGGWKFFGAGKC